MIRCLDVFCGFLLSLFRRTHVVCLSLAVFFITVIVHGSPLLTRWNATLCIVWFCVSFYHYV
jgi:hypothetical protein